MNENKPIALPSLELLNDRYRLDHCAGFLYFKSRGFGVTVGKRCGSPRPDGYRRIKINGKLYMEHRIIFYMSTGIDPMENDIDHIDRNRKNNRPKNLRIATRGKNMANGDVYSNSKTGFRGVYWHKQSKKFRTEIQVNHKKIYLGSFDDPIDAANAYNLAAKKHYGEFAYQNEIMRG